MPGYKTKAHRRVGKNPFRCGDINGTAPVTFPIWLQYPIFAARSCGVRAGKRLQAKWVAGDHHPASELRHRQLDRGKQTGPWLHALLPTKLRTQAL